VSPKQIAVQSSHALKIIKCNSSGRVLIVGATNGAEEETIGDGLGRAGTTVGTAG
jgi:hypothetical protein